MLEFFKGMLLQWGVIGSVPPCGNDERANSGEWSSAV